MWTAAAAWMPQASACVWSASWTSIRIDAGSPDATAAMNASVSTWYGSTGGDGSRAGLPVHFTVTSSMVADPLGVTSSSEGGVGASAAQVAVKVESAPDEKARWATTVSGKSTPGIRAW